ncbi:MAG: hypothetical protein NC110_01265 [Ruminococcus sp.]|nr:hypothetical protein [Ruminococcus sp.]
MGFMNKFRAFMYGRYGMDQLNIALLILGCAVTFVLSFTRPPYLRLLGFIPYVIVLIRALSHNIEGNRAANERFLKVWNKIKNTFNNKQRQAQDYNHKYYRCPQCSHVLRVPKGRGKIEITCPYCNRKFKKNTGKLKTS